MGDLSGVRSTPRAEPLQQEALSPSRSCGVSDLGDLDDDAIVEPAVFLLFLFDFCIICQLLHMHAASEHSEDDDSEYGFGGVGGVSSLTEPPKELPPRERSGRPTEGLFAMSL